MALVEGTCESLLTCLLNVLSPSVPVKTNTQSSSAAFYPTTSSTGVTYTAFPDSKAPSEAVVRGSSTTMSPSVASSDRIASGMRWFTCWLK